MTLKPDPQQIVEKLVSVGRCYVRLIDAADILLPYEPAWTERFLLRLVRRLYTHRLREMVATLPADVTAEILSASERMTGPVRGFTTN